MTEWLEPQAVGSLVLLRPPAPGDESALIEMAVDPEVRRYVGGPVGTDAALEKASRTVSSSTWGQFVVVERVAGDVVGSGDLAQKRGPWEVSYQLRRAYWGRGFARETLALLTEWFFAFTTEDLLIATTQRANERSRRLLERAGGTFAGSFRQYDLEQIRYEFRRNARSSTESDRCIAPGSPSRPSMVDSPRMGDDTLPGSR